MTTNTKAKEAAEYINSFVESNSQDKSIRLDNESKSDTDPSQEGANIVA